MPRLLKDSIYGYDYTEVTEWEASLKDVSISAVKNTLKQVVWSVNSKEEREDLSRNIHVLYQWAEVRGIPFTKVWKSISKRIGRRHTVLIGDSITMRFPKKLAQFGEDTKTFYPIRNTNNRGATPKVPLFFQSSVDTKFYLETNIDAKEAHSKQLATKEFMEWFSMMRMNIQDLKKSIKSYQTHGSNKVILSRNLAKVYKTMGQRYNREQTFTNLVKPLFDKASFSTCWVGVEDSRGFSMYPDQCSVFIVDTGDYCAIHYAENSCHQTRGGSWYSDYEAYRERSWRDRVVKDYSEDVLDHHQPAIAAGEGMPPNWSDSQVPWLGVELEVRVREPEIGVATEVLNDLPNFVICKRDSSITDNDSEGFEIVSVPATLKAHQERWETFFTGTATKLKGWFAQGCGMHIHISRNAFTDNDHLARFMVFMNASENVKFINAIAGRADSHYCSKIEKDFPTAKSECESDYASERYQAVNIGTRGNKTAEVRIFRSNVAKEGFLKNIEFVYSLWKYLRSTSREDVIHYTDYMTWVMRYGEEDYPNLHSWASRRRFITKELNLITTNLTEEEELIQCAL